MKKPIILKIEEGKEKIVKAINSTELPIFILEPIIKDVYQEIIRVKQQEYKKAEKSYIENLREENKNNERRDKDK